MNNLYNALSGSPGRNDLQMSAPAAPGMLPPSSPGVPGPSPTGMHRYNAEEAAALEQKAPVLPPTLFDAMQKGPEVANSGFPALINQKAKGQVQQDAQNAFGPKG